MNYYTRSCIAALLCMSLSSCTPSGQRLLTVQIESDGNVVFDGIRGVPDNTPVVEMWNVLGDIPFETTADDNSALDGEENARRLEGAIVVRIKHVDNELASASLKTLTLRSDDGGASWTLDGAEVKRIKVAAEE